MQVAPRYDDVVDEVTAFLEERLEAAIAAGVREEHVCLDPGIGFGKTPDQNLELVRRLDRICRIGRPVLVGALAQEHDGAGHRGRRTGASAPRPRRSARRWRPSTAARRSSASTTSPFTSTRSRPPRRSSEGAVAR